MEVSQPLDTDGALDALLHFSYQDVVVWWGPGVLPRLLRVLPVQLQPLLRCRLRQQPAMLGRKVRIDARARSLAGGVGDAPRFAAGERDRDGRDGVDWGQRGDVLLGDGWACRVEGVASVPAVLVGGLAVGLPTRGAPCQCMVQCEVWT